MARALSAARWPELGQPCLLLVPIGSLEQHGPHLPLDTDTVIATEITARVAAHLVESETASATGPAEKVVVAPPITYGASGEHHGFPGTLSIGTEALTTMLVEFVRSAELWTPRVVFVNAHGGNVFALQKAVGQLRAEGHATAWAACATEDVDLHAGRGETSLMLYLRPEAVDLPRAAAGSTAPLAQLLPDLMANGVRAVSPNGVLGDPAGASAEEGRAMTAAIVRDVLTRVRRGVPDQHGRLLADDPAASAQPSAQSTAQPSDQPVEQASA